MKSFNIIDGIGTSLQGYIYITYAELVQVFGKPHHRDTDKSKVEWLFEHLDSNTRFSVYDYNEAERTPLKDITEWHVGGDDMQALVMLNILFPYKKITLHSGGVLYKQLYPVKVALGAAMSKKASQNEKWFKKVKPDGHEIIIRVFDTYGEVKAFVDGMMAMQGWEDQCHIRI